MTCRYISDLCPAWTLSRQEALLAAHMPDYSTGLAYHDQIGRRRWTAGPEALATRAAMLTDLDWDTLYVASLAVLAFSDADLMAVLIKLAANGTDLVSVETGRRVSHTTSNVARKAAVQDFLNARKAATNAGRRVGAEASLAARATDVAERLDRIREDWSNPAFSTASLLLRAGRQKKGSSIVVPMSYNTTAAYLGKRPDALRKARAGLEASRRRRVAAETS